MNRGHRRTAAALILVLWAIAILSLLAGGLSFAVRQDLAIANIERDRAVAHCLARAGVERAIAAIMDDANSSDMLDEAWCDDAAEMEEVKLTGGTFSVVHDDYEPIPQGLYGAGDESAKLSINAATREQLLKLPHMTEPIAAAIIEWRSEKEDPEPGGAGGGYYTGLHHPYLMRKGPLRTVRELLLVRGVTPELLYGEDTNANGVLDANENDGDASEPADNADGRLDRGWLPYVTVYSYEKNTTGAGQRRLNLNQAGEAELAQRLNLEPWAAASIIKARGQRRFEHLVDLLDVPLDSAVRREPGAIDYYVRGENEKDRPVTPSIFAQIVDDLTLSEDETLSGRINVNTAPREVLATLPDVDADLAAAIARQRDTAGGFGSIGELLSVSGVTKEKFARFESCVTVRTSVFRIQSRGRTESGLAQATIECVVDRGNQEPRVMYWRESTP